MNTTKRLIVAALMIATLIGSNVSAALSEEEHHMNPHRKLSRTKLLHITVIDRVLSEHGKTIRTSAMLHEYCGQEGVALLIKPDEWISIAFEKLNEALDEGDFELELSIDERIAFVAGFLSEKLTYRKTFLRQHGAVIVYAMAVTGEEREVLETPICNTYLNYAGEILKNRETK